MSSELDGKISLELNSYVDRTDYSFMTSANWKKVYLFEMRIHSGGKNIYCELCLQ